MTVDCETDTDIGTYTGTYTDTASSTDCPDFCLSNLPCSVDADCAALGSTCNAAGQVCGFGVCYCGTPAPCTTQADCAKFGVACCDGGCQCPLTGGSDGGAYAAPSDGG
jgi:hypothetical protein